MLKKDDDWGRRSTTKTGRKREKLALYALAVLSISGWLLVGYLWVAGHPQKQADQIQQIVDVSMTAPMRTWENRTAKWCEPRTFAYNGRHCKKVYSELDLRDVFEVHKLEWANFGKTQAWWSVLTDPRWKGMQDIPPAIKDPFYDSGHADSKWIKKILTEYGVKPEGKLALDFGSGVGRVALMCIRDLGYHKVIGIDQSFWHLNIARREMKRLGYSDAIEFRVSDIDMLKTLDQQRVDFVVSVMVLQHMVPPLMVAYLEQMCDALRPGGHGFVQLPTSLPDDNQQFHCSFEASMQRGGMQMWYHDTEEVRALLLRRGCKTLTNFDYDVIGVPGGKCEAFFFEKMS